MKLKKLLSITLALLMVFSLCPHGAFSLSVNAAVTVTSGTTFECTWNLEGTKLTISGNGSTGSYSEDSELPWGTDITEVVIENGVKDIGNYVFVNCKNLKSITIPDSVTSIGYGAFSGCSKSLESIYVGENNARYTSVNNCLIDKETKTLILGCKNSVIPSDGSVTSIGNSAFLNCCDLESITIPDSVESIGREAFYNTAYYNNLLNWENGVLYIGKHLIGTDYEAVSGDYTIKDGTLTIADWAFYFCYNLESITIPDSVENIGKLPFNDCINLTSITVQDGNAVYHSSENCLIETASKTLIKGCENSIIPSDGSVTSIGYMAFYDYCDLESITIPDGVTSISDYAFEHCSYLESITISDSVESIGRDAFYNTAYYENTSNWENGVLYIGKHLIAADADTISGNYTIKDGTLTIAGGAFRSCYNLESITIPDSVKSIGVMAFSGCLSLKSIIIPGSVTSIGVEVFAYCKSLENIAIPSSVKNIGDCAFFGCSSLKSITIPGSVTSIGNSAFYWCNGLKSVTMQDGVTSIGDNAFYICESLESITIPESVTSIGDSAFDYCSGNFTIYGKYGTAAAKYAKNNDIKFVDKSHSCTSFKTITAKATFSEYGMNEKVCETCEKVVSTTTIHKVSSVKLSTTSYTYDGKAKKPTVTVKDSNGKVLKLNTDYTVSYYNNTKAGKASVKVTLKGSNYTGTKTLNFTINGKKVTPTVSGYKAKVYNGKAQKQTLTVKVGKTTLKTSQYTVTYTNNKYVGKATAKVTLKGNYSGTKTVTFKINPKATSVKSVASGKKQFTANWNKQATQTSGYQVQYSTNKNFKNAKTVTVTSTKTTSKTVKNLKAKTKYYVRVRTYKTVKNAKYYSAWSATKNVTTKK